MDSHRAIASSHGSDPKGSAECLAKFAVEEKPKCFRETEPAGNANDNGGAPVNQRRQLASGLIQVHKTIESGKVRQCSVEHRAIARLRVDHSLRGITPDNRYVQQCKKECILHSAIDRQDCIAGLKNVSNHCPHGSALGADPGNQEKIVVPPGETINFYDRMALRCGGGSQAFTSKSVESRPHRAG